MGRPFHIFRGDEAWTARGWESGAPVTPKPFPTVNEAREEIELSCSGCGRRPPTESQDCAACKRRKGLSGEGKGELVIRRLRPSVVDRQRESSPVLDRFVRGEDD